ncbi:hypothetical protein ACFLYP_02120, partial [Chloroflexota bacterium]
EIRQLPGTVEVHQQIIPKLKLRIIADDIFITEKFIATLPDEALVLKALGLMQEDYDLVLATLNSRVDGIGGFYQPGTNMIHLIGSDFGDIEKWIYAHEYTHALTDQHFNLGQLGTYPECQLPSQNCLAIQALVEGEAEVVQAMWFEQYGQLVDINLYLFTPGTPLFSDGQTPPPYFSMNSVFAYTIGGEFVAYLVEQGGGWRLVNQAYANLPTTTEHILHPAKYLKGEDGIPVDDPPVCDALGEGWRLVERDSLGEWETMLLLGFGANEFAQLSPEVALGAAAGWGGDSYQVCYHEQDERTVLAAHWTWDTGKDHNEFLNSLNVHLAGRFQNASVEAIGKGTCWLYAGRYSCTFSQGKDVLWLIAPDLDTIETIKGLYPQFP